ncbi:ROK family protein [bacterium BMS3Abin03]|jgi:glucokinase|nr:ROK family protein [bacterium BMS3Abin03]MCG6958661.1 ROK family protein [bacterium BMS3Abin03]
MEDKTIIGVDLGGTNIRVGKIYNDKVTDLYTRQISSTGIEQKVIDEIITSIKKIFNNSILGIGVGVPSVVDVEKGIVYDVQNIPAFRKVYLKDILEKEFKVPVYINNDANCFVVGEKYFGAGKNYKDIVGLILGTGLGSGIYTNDKLYMGANCGAGEFGMISYKDSNYEDYCCGQFFIKKNNTTGEDIYRKAVNGDNDALEIFNEFGYHVGNAISAIVLSVDPEIIILGGSVSKAYDYFKNSLNMALDTFPYQNSIKRLKIVVSKLKQVSILGAAALYFENKK